MQLVLCVCISLLLSLTRNLPIGLRATHAQDDLTLTSLNASYKSPFPRCGLVHLLMPPFDPLAVYKHLHFRRLPRSHIDWHRQQPCGWGSGENEDHGISLDGIKSWIHQKVSSSSAEPVRAVLHPTHGKGPSVKPRSVYLAKLAFLNVIIHTIL